VGRIARGWALTRESWEVLKHDRSLAIFPILSAIFAIIAVLAIGTPTLIISGVFDGRSLDQNDPVIYVAGVAVAYVSTFIAIFFNVALASCAARSMRGEDTQVGEGIKAAAQRIGPILGWTFVTTTVGLILRVLETLKDRLPLVGEIIAAIVLSLAGAAWAIASFFVVPVVALEGTGPIRSLERSAAVVKARWGEGATGAATIGLVTFLVSVAIAVIGVVGYVALAGVGVPLLAVAVAAIAVVGILVVSLVSSTMSQIFRVAVYEYALSGQAPGRFDGQLLQSAFKGPAPNEDPWNDPITGQPL
jgi:Family of unknown function (DUF6159)